MEISKEVLELREVTLKKLLFISRKVIKEIRFIQDVSTLSY